MEHTLDYHRMLSLLSHTERELLERSVSDVHFSRKSTIFSEGDSLAGIYIIHSGMIKVCLNAPTGKEHIVRLCGRGDIIGYQSILSSSPSPTTAIAMSDVKAYHLRKSTLFSIIKSNSTVTRELLSLLSHEIQNTQVRMFSLAYKSVAARIAESLLSFGQVYGYYPDRQTIAGPIYRKDLAEYAGVTVESTIRTLGQMRESGYIEIQNKHIVIKDRKTLQHIAADE